MIEWKYTNGSCRVAYMSVLVGMSVESTSPIFGCRHVFGCVGEFAMSCWYAFHVLPAAVELVGDRLHRRRVHAPLPERLLVGAGAGRHEVAEVRAVGLGLRVRRLAADLRDVVVEARVADRRSTA